MSNGDRNDERKLAREAFQTIREIPTFNEISGGKLPSQRQGC
jgi:hypothetical protein